MPFSHHWGFPWHRIAVVIFQSLWQNARENVLKEGRLIFIIVFSLRSAASIASRPRQGKLVADGSALHSSRMHERKERVAQCVVQRHSHWLVSYNETPPSNINSDMKAMCEANLYIPQWLLNTPPLKFRGEHSISKPQQEQSAIVLFCDFVWICDHFCYVVHSGFKHTCFF